MNSIMDQEIKIVQSSLTSSEAKIIQSEIRNSTNITGYSHNELLGLERVFKAFCNRRFAGICANDDFGKDWTELSAFVVLSDFRGRDIGKKLFAAAWADAINRKKNIYIVSRNPIMIKMIKKSGAQIIKSFWQLPAAVKFHIIKFAISWYRAKEFLRKLPMKKSGKFVFGVRLIT